MNAKEIINQLKLIPHPEGGFYRETYRSEKIARAHLPAYYTGDRSYSTAIYYLLTPDTFSEIHKIVSDEIFHFYLGDPVEMINLLEDGTGKVLTLGNNIAMGMQPQVIVHKNVWQGCRLKAGGKFALLGTTVAPGFDFEDYKSGEREDLSRHYPEYHDWIVELTRK